MADIDNLIHDGNELAQASKWDEALECYRAASALEPTNPEIWFLIGCCHFKMNYGAGAREAWERALLIDPTFEKARVWIHRVTGLSGQIPITAKT